MLSNNLMSIKMADSVSNRIQVWITATKKNTSNYTLTHANSGHAIYVIYDEENDT